MDELQIDNNRQQITELLKDHVQSQKDAINTFEQKSLQNLIVVNIIAGIIAAFNLPRYLADPSLQELLAGSQEATVIAIAVSLVFLVLYSTIAYLSIRVLWIKTMDTHPMTPTIRNIYDWTYTDPARFSELLQGSYLQIYNNNARLVRSRANMVRWSHILMTLLIILTFVTIVALGYIIVAMS